MDAVTTAPTPEERRQRRWFLFWRAASTLSISVGLLIMAGSPLIAGFLLGVLHAWTNPGAPIDAERVARSWLPMAGFVLILGASPLMIGLRLWRRGSRWRAPSAAALLAAGATPAVLFLRSFSVERPPTRLASVGSSRSCTCWNGSPP